jgi:hypothetical protein
LRLSAIAATALAVGLLLARARATRAAIAQPLSLAGSGYAGSSACRTCHPGNYASWHRTFHRTMTQEASARSVLGDFEHGSLDYLGVHARMRRDERGQFVIEWTRGGGLERWSAVVERTVGSRRYQQYLARDHDVYYRLPIAWNIEEQRFMHMNGAFLTPDPTPAPGEAVARTDYDRHVTRWNDNCVYCHNVAPNPGLDVERGGFTTHVAELGIACEACHGPAQRHVEQNRDPLRRFMLHLGEQRDPTIANPARLGAARSAQVCGHCHGQRIAPDIEHVHRFGDRFVPGEDLMRYSTPLARDTALHGDSRAFAARFWPDGTARLTAYEYQGLLQSACAEHGELTCTTCHGMHEGDPRGQLRPARSDDGACTGCHRELASAQAVATHSHHPAGSPGARCLECHMPRIVYGLVGAHRSHHIDSPRPELATDASHPDACTLCHADESREWAAAALARWRGTASIGVAQPQIPEVTRALLEGDPIERAIAAAALGQNNAGTPERTPARIGLLLDIMREDAYPAVRAIAWRSLRALLAQAAQPVPEVAAFTATDSAAARAGSLDALQASWPQNVWSAPDAAIRALRVHRADVDISIGE